MWTLYNHAKDRQLMSLVRKSLVMIAQDRRWKGRIEKTDRFSSISSEASEM